MKYIQHKNKLTNILNHEHTSMSLKDKYVGSFILPIHCIHGMINTMVPQKMYTKE